MNNHELPSNPTFVISAATGGLIISKTEAIQSFLSTSSDNYHLSSDLRRSASTLSRALQTPPLHLGLLGSFVPTRSIRSPLRIANHPQQSPTSRKSNECEELKARLRKLEEMAERKAYKELVKDITRKGESEPFSSYKDQLGFGLHVALMMFTGYLVGYATFRALFDQSPVMNVAGGILGLVLGMLIETLLFIIRTSSRDCKATFVASKLKKNQ